MGAPEPTHPDPPDRASPERRLAAVFESRLVAAVELARERRESGQDAAAMPCQRPGVVAPSPDQVGRSPWTPRRKAIHAAVIALPFTLILGLLLVFAPGFRLRMFTNPLLVMVIAMVPPLAFSMWVMHDTRRRGRAFAPGWALGVVGVYFAGLMALFILGALPIRNASMVGVLAICSSFGLLTPARKRHGQELRCSKCEYEYVYTDPAGPAAPDACSECGARWHEWRGLVRGRKARARVWVMALGAALWFGVMLLPMMSGRLTTLATTGALIDAVTAPRAGFTMDEWAVLNNRTLSEAQRLRLARGLLDLRLAEEDLDKDADAWLLGAVQDGSLPRDLVERHFRELASVTLLAPVRCRVGQEAILGLETVDRSTPFGLSVPLVAIESFTVDGREGVIAERSDRLVGPDGVAMRGRRSGFDARIHQPRSVSVFFSEPGRQRVRCVYWLVVMGQFSFSQPIVWNSDGTPVVPAGALFSERREIWVDIEVER